MVRNGASPNVRRRQLVYSGQNIGWQHHRMDGCNVEPPVRGCTKISPAASTWLPLHAPHVTKETSFGRLDFLARDSPIAMRLRTQVPGVASAFNVYRRSTERPIRRWHQPHEGLGFSSFDTPYVAAKANAKYTTGIRRNACAADCACIFQKARRSTMSGSSSMLPSDAREPSTPCVRQA
jgi:hypothetical protein